MNYFFHSSVTLRRLYLQCSGCLVGKHIVVDELSSPQPQELQCLRPKKQDEAGGMQRCGGLNYLICTKTAALG